MLPPLTYLPPSIGPTVVARERLTSIIDVAVQQPFTTVVAPPGYGKTVAIAQWAAAHPRRRIRWVPLSAELDDAVLFSRVLAEALGVPSLSDLRTMAPTVLVLDDFHVLTRPDLLEDFARFVDVAPIALHFVVATRHDLPLALHRLRCTSSSIEIRQDDLAFDASDAAELLERLTSARLSEDQIAALVARTEGWVAGLQLAALSLRGRSDTEAFVAAFAGDDRHVADYLTERVLDRLPETLRQFVLRTSVLEQLSGPLCDLLTDGSGSQVVLEELLRQSVFTTAQDEEHRWFRYHPLFRVFLRQHLRDQDRALEHDLHVRSAAWHFERDHAVAGVQHLLDAGEWHDVVDAAAVHGRGMLAQGRAGTVASWIRAVPAEVRAADGRALLLEATGVAFGGDPADAFALIDEVRASVRSSAGHRVVAAMLSSFAALRRGDTARAVAEAEQTLRAVAATSDDDLPDVLGLTSSRAAIASAAHVMAGIAHNYRGEHGEARRSLDAAFAGDQATLVGGHATWHVLATGADALARAWAGELTAAEQLAGRALAFAQELGVEQENAVTDALLALAHVARSRGDGPGARALLDELARQPQPDHRRLVAAIVAIEHALVDLAAGNGAEALRALARAPDHPLVPPWILARRRAVEAQALMQIGEPLGAAQALELAPCESTDVTLARIHLDLEHGDRLAARSHVALLPASLAGRPRDEKLLWLAVIDELDGRTEDAMARMAEVAADAEAERDVSLLRDNRSAMGLVRALYRSEPTPFLRGVVEQPVVAVRSRPSMALVEQLTDRELMVMALLPTRMSNTEIAEVLGVSLNTLKTHLKHIYRKLDVAERSEAVAAAEELRLL